MKWDINNIEYFVTCPVGMETVLEQELVQLLSRKVRRVTGGVGFHGPVRDLYQVMLWSRVANRAMMLLTRFSMSAQDDLYSHARALPWDSHFAAHATFAVKCTGRSELIPNTHFAALRVKDAVVDYFRELTGDRPSVDKQAPDARITAHFGRKTCSIYLDFCTSGLHRRGYRQSTTAAPLRENVAAGLLLMNNWPQIAADGGSFYDPFCGSGTFLIEAALMAVKKAPGLCRSTSSIHHWQQHDDVVWQQLYQEAQVACADGMENLSCVISGSDVDRRALTAAQQNIERAGVHQCIKLSQADVTTQLPDDVLAQKPGLLLTNPPYGQRLGNKEDLHTLYYSLGRLISNLPGWQAAVLVEDATQLRAMQLQADSTRNIHNGPIECVLAAFHVDQDQEVLPAIDAVQQGVSEGIDAFANRLRKNKRHLDKWARREGISCYRLYDRDLPEFALAVDVYHGDQVWLHVQEYEAPAGVDPVKAQLRLQAVCRELPGILDIAPEHVAVKTRRRQKDSTQYERLDQQRDVFVVSEGMARFQVNLVDYLDSGLFLDSRSIRARIAQRAAGKRFLNLFCYTGTATVQAALAGASSSCSVDMSRTYLDWAQRNFRLNDIDLRHHVLVQADCLAWLHAEARRPQNERGLYDVILLDPPTVSRSKRMTDSLDVQRDHVSMITDAMSLLVTDGTLLFVTNFRKFKMDVQALSAFKLKNISAVTLPQDFSRNPKIHQCWEITH